MRRPRRIGKTATIGISALSGRVDPALLASATARLESRGHRLIVAPEATKEWRYFAGTDAERVAGFHRLLDDPSIDVMMAARGGYGLTRVVGLIDWERVAASGKAFVGFSDFTAFNLAAYARERFVTFHGPMLTSDFGGEAPDAFMERHYWDVLRSDPHELEPVACRHGLGERTIEGTLWGGNLALLADLVGTPYFPAIEGGILYIEEIGEQPYAVERMFYQLLHAGILARQQAVLLGEFRDCDPTNTSRYPYAMHEVIESLRAVSPCPVLAGLPFGHIGRKATLPFGASGVLRLGKDVYTLGFSGYLAP